MSTYRYSSDGKNLAVLNSNTLSTAEVNKNGFAATIQSQGGVVLNEDAVKGQRVADNHTYKLDKKVGRGRERGIGIFQRSGFNRLHG